MASYLVSGPPDRATTLLAIVADLKAQGHNASIDWISLAGSKMNSAAFESLYAAQKRVEANVDAILLIPAEPGTTKAVFFKPFVPRPGRHFERPVVMANEHIYATQGRVFTWFGWWDDRLPDLDVDATIYGTDRKVA